MKQYKKARKLKLQEVIPYILTKKHRHKSDFNSRCYWCHNIKRSVRVNFGSAKMQLFGRSQHCAACKIEADHFWIEKDPNCFSWHMNMYAIDHKGRPVLMTLDHIKPKSKGGTREISNIQLLCCECNNIKGNRKISLDTIRKTRLGNVGLSSWPTSSLVSLV